MNRGKSSSSFSSDHVCRPKAVSTESPYLRQSAINLPNKPKQQQHAPFTDNTRLQRGLGPIETTFHRYTLHGMDRICFMLHFLSKQKVTENHVRHGLMCLIKRHPLLRMTIRGKPSLGKTYFKFVEMENPAIDLQVSYETNWQRVMQAEINEHVDPFEGPLWKCKVMELKEPHHNVCDCAAKMSTGDDKTEHLVEGSVAAKENQTRTVCDHNDDFSFQSRLILTWHHSIIDAGYMCWVIRDFIVFLDSAMKDQGQRLTPNNVRSLPLMPNVENVLTPTLSSIDQLCNSPSAPINDVNPKYSIVQLKGKEPSHEILNKYINKYSAEITALSENESENKNIPLEFCKRQTKELFQQCKRHGVSINGAIWAASVSSLLNMLYENEEIPDTLSIPFEFVLDFRKHFSVKASSDMDFAGVASTNVTMAAEFCVDRVPIGHVEFWEMAKSFSDGIRNEVKSLNVLDQIDEVRRENDRCVDVRVQKGKSPFVICVSNIGVLDFLIPDDVSNRLKLVALHGNSSILIDDMPVFLLGIHTLNGQLCTSISYCANYTSDRTATDFSKRFQAYLGSGSRL